MAKRYALVPESWLATFNQNGSFDVKSLANEKAETQNHETENKSIKTFFEKEQKLTHLADLLAKNLRNRARILLHYLENANVNVNDVQRIVYSDGTVGSHILDLTRYAVSPFVKTRPLDWPQFSTLLDTLGVPASAIAKRQPETKPSILERWKPY